MCQNKSHSLNVPFKLCKVIITYCILTLLLQYLNLRNKGKLAGQVPHRDFYFVAWLVFLVNQLSIMYEWASMPHSFINP